MAIVIDIFIKFASYESSLLILTLPAAGKLYP